jgi:hypothetical protein
MIKLINILNEIYPTTLTEAYSFVGPKKKSSDFGGAMVIYNFTNRKGDNMFVSIENEFEYDWINLIGNKAKSEDITDDDLILDVTFGKTKGNTWAQTESGDGLAVLNTVSDILKKFIEVDFKGYGEFTLNCHPATEEEEETSRDSKRDKIYKMFAEKMVRQLPYIESTSSSGEAWGDEEYALYLNINKPQS